MDPGSLNKAKSVIISSAVTEVKTTQSVFKWQIKNFSLCSQKVGECLVSPSFPSARNIFWQIKCFPRGDCEKRRETLCVYLYLMSAPTTSKKSAIAVEFKLSIVKASGKHCQIATSDKVKLFSVGQSWGMELMHNNILLNPKYEYLSDDTLSLHCHVTTVIDTVVLTNVPECLDERNSVNCDLTDDLEDLLSSGMFYDVIFCVGDSEFPAHRNILAARSPVFKTMFEDKKQTNVRLEVTGIALDIFQHVLSFIYTGKMEYGKESAAGLLAAAHRYALDKLKRHCEDTLCSQLSVENAVDHLILSDINCAQCLKEKAISLINRNASRVTGTEQWKAIVQSHPRLLGEVYEKLIHMHMSI